EAYRSTHSLSKTRSDRYDQVMVERSWTIAVRPADESLKRARRAAVDGAVQAMPLRLEATVANVVPRAGDPAIALTMEVEVRALQPVVTAIAADTGLTAELLRTLPLSRLAKYATIGAAYAFESGAIRDELRRGLSADGS